jgi:CheY-like chemotaxis protein
VDAERIGPEGAKLRCTKCSAVFLVRAPKASPPSDAAVAPPPAEPAPNVDPARLVLIADSDEARGKATADAVRGWGLVPHLVHDGVEAMLAIQRMLPTAIVLDAALPKMFGFQVCEVVKRNESLRDTKVVLVGAIHHQDRYRRNPSEIYGADSYVEGPDLPDALLSIFRAAELPMGEGAPAAKGFIPASPPEMPRSTPVVEQPAPIPAPAPPRPATPAAAPSRAPEPEPELDFDLDFDSSVEEPVQEEPAPTASAPAAPDGVESPERTAERERAERLARIAVSEMVLYQPEKFDQASRNGTLEQALDLEIQEARALLRQRISEEVRAETDFIIDELQRVAQSRGQQT